ncbi:MAG: hypothetical protein OEY79_02000 [Anaplasmataceae bacterium]|nr:hypothetical protein [Anaplasmataceae bacterium]
MNLQVNRPPQPLPRERTGTLKVYLASKTSQPSESLEGNPYSYADIRDLLTKNNLLANSTQNSSPACADNAVYADNEPIYQEISDKVQSLEDLAKKLKGLNKSVKVARVDESQYQSLQQVQGGENLYASLSISQDDGQDDGYIVVLPDDESSKETSCVQEDERGLYIEVLPDLSRLPSYNSATKHDVSPSYDEAAPQAAQQAAQQWVSRKLGLPLVAPSAPEHEATTSYVNPDTTKRSTDNSSFNSSGATQQGSSTCGKVVKTAILALAVGSACYAVANEATKVVYNNAPTEQSAVNGTTTPFYDEENFKIMQDAVVYSAFAFGSLVAGGIAGCKNFGKLCFASAVSASNNIELGQGNMK